MDDAPRQTLRALVARHGTGLCSDARRCEALLRDLAGAHRREVNILVSALKERVPLDLLAGQSAMPRGLLLARLAKRLEDHLGLTGEAARWAVDSWALALGVVTEEEVAEREQQPAPPRREDAAENESRAAQSSKPPQAPTPPQQPPQRQPQTASPPPVVVSPAGRPPVTTTTRAPQTPAASKGVALPSPAQAPARDARPRRRRSLRGCAVGCLLIVLLALALFVGGPFVVSLLREEQQQREPSPVLSP